MKAKKNTTTSVSPNKTIIKKSGLPPGSLIYTGNALTEQIEIDYIVVNHDEVNSGTISTDDLAAIPEAHKYLWLDIRGLNDIPFIESIGSKFDIHRLWLEDILHVQQLGKFDDVEGNCFISIPFLSLNHETQTIEKEQISIFFNKQLVISFQENPANTFLGIKDRIWQNPKRFAERRPDYLAYAMLDLTIDNYLEVINFLEERIDQYEYNIESDPNVYLKKRIYHFRRECTNFTRLVSPAREIVQKFKLSNSEAISKETRIYLSDLHDHAQQVNQSSESLKDMLYNLTDLFHSEINYRSNVVIKTLTVITAIFIPLTFIVGVYGMNFDNMPELKNPHGYYIVWAVMIFIALSAFGYFKLKKWI